MTHNAHPLGNFFSKMARDQRKAEDAKRKKAGSALDDAKGKPDDKPKDEGALDDAKGKPAAGEGGDQGALDSAKEKPEDDPKKAPPADKSKDKPEGETKDKPKDDGEAGKKGDGKEDDPEPKKDDATKDDAKKDDGEKGMDAVQEVGPASAYTDTDIAISVAAALQEWAETADMDDGETSAGRLAAMMVGIADADFDGEIGEAESAVLEIALEAAWDYLSAKGASDDDLDKLLNDWDVEAANRLQELLAGALPDGDEAAADDIDNFAFGDGGDESAMDAVYKKRLVIRGGRKVRINKRISGRVRLSAKQKISIRKASRKARSAVAQMRRAKSMRIRQKSGLG